VTDRTSQEQRFIPMGTQWCRMLTSVIVGRTRVVLDSELRSGIKKILRRGIDQSSRRACSRTAPCLFLTLIKAFPRLVDSYPPACAGGDSAKNRLFGSLA
jgi:hypothetical protein